MDEQTESQFGDTVTLVNRTRGELRCQWNGAHYRFKSGRTPGVPLPVAIKACKDNPLNGSEHPYDPNDYQSLCGIEGTRGQFADCSPIEQSNAGERINRRLLVGDGEGAKRKNAGGPTYFEAMAGVGNVDTSADAITRNT